MTLYVILRVVSNPHGAKMKKMQWKGRKDRRVATCATETQATTMLGIKVHNIMEFHLTLVFYAFQLYGKKW